MHHFFNSVSLFFYACLLMVTKMPTIRAQLSLPPYPVGGFGGGKCGPQEIPLGTVDKWTFPYMEVQICSWRWFWYPCGVRTLIHIVDFRPVCAVHDKCYGAIFREPEDCQVKATQCNEVFAKSIVEVCNDLPELSQRLVCRGIAGTFIGLVHISKRAYLAWAGCSREHTIRALSKKR